VRPGLPAPRQLARSVLTASAFLAALTVPLGVDPVRPADALAAPRPANIVVLGDSVPSGGACGCVPFGPRYGAMVARHTGAPAETTNLARGGYTVPDVRQQLETAPARAAIRAATTVVIMVGANDLGPAYGLVRRGAPVDATFARAAREVRADVTAAVERIRSLHRGPVQVAVLGYWNVFRDGRVGLESYGAAGLALANTATRYANRGLAQAAENTASRYVDSSPAFKGPDGTEDPTPLLAPDGDHPNAAGHARIALRLLRALPNG
jgi:lysophospholipase L1-like esterase